MEELKVYNDIKIYKDQENKYILAIAPVYYFSSCLSDWENTVIGSLLVQKLSFLCEKENCQNIIVYIFCNENDNTDITLDDMKYFTSKYFKDYEQFIFTFLQCKCCGLLLSLGKYTDRFEQAHFDEKFDFAYCEECLENK